MSVRAKFYLSSVERWPGSKGGSVKLKPVYSNDPNHENKRFWDATPGGEISLQINNPEAFNFFVAHGVLNKEFYIDFSLAD